MKEEYDIEEQTRINTFRIESLEKIAGLQDEISGRIQILLVLAFILIIVNSVVLFFYR